MIATALLLAQAAPAAAQEVTLDLSLEARVRHEGLAGSLPEGGEAEGYRWFRLMPRAEAEAGPVRLVVEGIAAWAEGIADPGPADATAIDLLQGYGEVAGRLGDVALTLRGGRALIALGSERLVGRRYGPNVPRAFDGVQVAAQHGALQLRGLALRPVRAGPRSFDDRAEAGRRLTGIYASWTGAPSGVELYWLVDARRAQDAQRATWGVRVFGAQGAWRWNWEAMLQRGNAGTRRIRAWSLASETALVAAPVTLRLRANVASGDRDARDGVDGTFDPLYPKGQYFGELSPIGPRNLINLHPGIEWAVNERVTLGAAAVVYWRHRQSDGVYDLTGRTLRPPGGRARHIGTQGEMVVGWQATGRLNLGASWSRFAPGRALGGTALTMVAVEATLAL